MFEVLFFIFIIVMAFRDRNKPTRDYHSRRNGRGHYYR